jgi:hypothetical protein
VKEAAMNVQVVAELAAAAVAVQGIARALPMIIATLRCRREDIRDVIVARYGKEPERLEGRADREAEPASEVTSEDAAPLLKHPILKHPSSESARLGQVGAVGVQQIEVARCVGGLEAAASDGDD